jgi:hypothetical protein
VLLAQGWGEGPGAKAGILEVAGVFAVNYARTRRTTTWEVRGLRKILVLAERKPSDSSSGALLSRGCPSEQRSCRIQDRTKPFGRCPKRGFPSTVAAMSNDDEWTPGDVASVIANPFYAINIDEGLAVSHEPLISEDDWITANVRLIEELGAEPYLRNLLLVLKGNYPRGL